MSLLELIIVTFPKIREGYKMSDLMKANVEALARGIKPQCYFDPDFRECTVYNHDSHCYCGL